MSAPHVPTAEDRARGKAARDASRTALAVIETHGVPGLVRLIEAFKNGASTTKLAADFGVTRQTMWAWRTRLGEQKRTYIVHPNAARLAEARQDDLICPLCGKVLEWACWGKLGTATCTAGQTQRLPVDPAKLPLCMFRGTVRRGADDIVRLVVLPSAAGAAERGT